MRIACVQANVVFNDPAANIVVLIRRLEALKRDGVDLALFPEAFLTGYCVDSLADARQIAIDRRVLIPIREACDKLGITTIVGFAERSGDNVFNAATLIEPGQDPQYYRKSHLPFLGLDRFVHAGDELPVFDTALGRIGILICFDLRIPEAARVLALRGAELIALPTNWPEGAETSAEHVSIARAAENRVFMATCNRVGEENGFRFIGRSKIIAPSGKVLAAAGVDEQVLVCDLDLAEARIKRNVMIPGKYETAVFESRRPELYGDIAPAANREADLPTQSAPLWV
ncbi:MAG TPA: carbon-nitrogen hydrolase family protein [Fimbriimonadaceae bacterium]|nr:carbon-nitrogen hydrolase family protein [Fimbriimonadaceae bacterium]